MQYYALAGTERSVLAAFDGDEVYDLTSANPNVETFSDLARAANITDRTVDDVAEGLLDDANRLSSEDLVEHVERPVTPDEVWAAGVTYHISEQARETESGTPAKGTVQKSSSKRQRAGQSAHTRPSVSGVTPRGTSQNPNLRWSSTRVKSSGLLPVTT